MIIDENNTMLDVDNYIFLKNKCDDFVITETPTKNFFEKDGGEKHRNYYNRYFFDLSDENVKEITEKSISYIKKTTKFNEIRLMDLWVNKVDTETNKNDGFHKDSSDLTIIVYLNDDFEGGELEYFNENNKKVKIKPKKNLIIVMDNKVHHRVLPLVNGVRYSLIVFFEIEKKKNKTLM